MLCGLGAVEEALAELSEFGGEGVVALAGEPGGVDFGFEEDGGGEVGAAWGAVFVGEAGEFDEGGVVAAEATVRRCRGFRLFWGVWV